MGYLIAYLFGFVTALKPTQGPINSVYRGSGSDRRNEGAADSSALAPQIPPAEGDAEGTCRCCHHKTPWWKVMLDTLTFLAAAGAAVAAIYYAVVTRGMWKQMQTQTKTAQQQLESSDRAWIKLVAIETSDLKFAQNGDASISFKPAFQNIGRTVATYVSVAGKLVLQDEKHDFFREPMAVQNEICSELARAPIGPSAKTTVSMDQTVFPGDVDSELWYGSTITKREIGQRKKDVVLKSGPGALIFPIYVGCIDYQFGTATRHHQTGFAFSLRWRDRTIPPGFVNEVAIKVGHSVPNTDVILEKWSFGGFYAD
jgi:hypothetical protein